VLACGPGALLSHRSAADRHGLLRSASPRIEMSAPRGRRRRDGIVLHRPRVLDEEDRAAVDGIPVTSVARTLVDVAGVLDLPRLERALDSAERARTLDLAAVDHALDRLPRAKGRRRLIHLIERFRPEAAFTRSEAERRFLALCRRHVLPPPQANLWIAGHEIDFYWPDAGLAVEIDGREYHSGASAFHADRRRDRALLAVGIETARVTWEDLREPARLAEELRTIRSGRARR
jgi:very-short-patch-repair endonuclease